MKHAKLEPELAPGAPSPETPPVRGEAPDQHPYSEPKVDWPDLFIWVAMGLFFLVSSPPSRTFSWTRTETS